MARRARMAPERSALVFGERRYSYGELSERSLRLARALEARGVREGDRVAFLGHNHPAALETLFACGLLGAVAMPVHPGFDATALRRVFADASPATVVVTPELLPVLEDSGAADATPTWLTTELVVRTNRYCEDLASVIATAADEPLDRAVDLDRACLLAFSSGTTGPNKGVVLTHGNLFFNAVNVLTALDYLRDDVILTSAPLYRMGGLGLLLALFMKGGTCVLQERADPELSLQLIERHAVTIVFDSVPSLERMSSSRSFTTRDLSSLRVCVTGGSPVPASLVTVFGRRGLSLQPGYGLTEASPLALIVDRAEVETHPGAAGRPPFFCDARVVDDHGDDVAVGEVGELWVHGPNVMREYWKRPKATERTLVEGRWLRTGDAACPSEDGMITVLGRVADALQLGDRRAHPGPVEDRLRREPGVSECAIVQTAPGVAPTVFVVPAADQRVDRAVLAAATRAGLRITSPVSVRLVGELPKNPNGKILRAELRRRGCGMPARSSRIARARNEPERKVCD